MTLKEFSYIAEIAAAAVAVFTMLGGVAAWISNWAGMIKQNNADIQAIKTNHLPHIYYRLGLICKALGIENEEGML